jgi:hypothetical protein
MQNVTEETPEELYKRGLPARADVPYVGYRKGRVCRDPGVFIWEESPGKYFVTSFVWKMIFGA